MQYLIVSWRLDLILYCTQLLDINEILLECTSIRQVYLKKTPNCQVHNNNRWTHEFYGLCK